jgi:prolyl-tRNA synthetase
VIRRDRLYQESGKLATLFMPRDEFTMWVGPCLESIQQNLFAEAQVCLQNNIARDVIDLAGHFSRNDGAFTGWAEVQWSRPTGAALAKVVEQLKSMKLTIRNVPQNAAAADGTCIFTGDPAVERILIAKAY